MGKVCYNYKLTGADITALVSAQTVLNDKLKTMLVPKFPDTEADETKMAFVESHFNCLPTALQFEVLSRIINDIINSNNICELDLNEKEQDIIKLALTNYVAVIDANPEVCKGLRELPISILRRLGEM
jgi:hypothetical protein